MPVRYLIVPVSSVMSCEVVGRKYACTLTILTLQG